MFWLVFSVSFAASGNEAASGTVLEEVVVTAQKREQSIQDVPIAITAFDGQVQRDLSWDSPIDMINQVPNVVGQSLIGTTQPTFYIRGIGTSDLHHSAQSPVGIYVDEVYYNSTIAQGFQLFDLERVEVLRGPQGTLWGKNTTGGAMHFVSAMPTHELGGYAEFSYGLYNDDTPDIEVEGVINGSLVENVLAGRIAAKANIRDGWVYNEFTGEDIEELDRFAGRFSLAYTPNEDLEALLNVTVGRQRGDHVVLHHQQNANPAAFTVLPYMENPARDRVSQDRDAPEDVDFTGATLRINWEQAFGTFTSITGYINVERDEDADADASPFSAGGGPFRNETEQWTQELRFTSSQENRFRWIAGAFYFNETIDGSTTIIDGPDGFGPFCPPTNICGAQNDEDRERESYAVYGSFDYDISNELTLTGGVRWTHDEEELGIGLFYYSAHPNADLDGTPASIVPGTLAVVSDSSVNILDETWSEFTGDVTLSYRLSNEASIYGKFSHGYLAGTHVIPFAFLREINTLNPEKIDAVEAGIKTTLLDGRLQLNMAGFYYDYSNIQVSRVDPNNAGQGQRRENAASADVYGFEAEFKFRPVEQLYLSGGLGYTDSTYADFLSFNAGTSSIDDFSDNRTLNTPKWNANGLMLYTVPLSVGSMEFQTDWTYQSKLYFAPNNNSLEIGEDRAVGNVALRYISNGEKWRLTAYARNVLDEEYTVNVRDFSPFWGVNLEIIGAPRVFGLTFDITF